MELAGIGPGPHAAMILGADSLGAQAAPDRGNLRGSFHALEHRNGGELEIGQQIETGVQHVGDRGDEPTVVETLAHDAPLCGAIDAWCHG